MIIEVNCITGEITEREPYEGEIPVYVEPAPQIPPVSPRQIRQALTQLNLRSVVEEAITAGSQDLKDWWEFSTEFLRTHPEVIDMGKTLGKTPEELDQLWVLAASL